MITAPVDHIRIIDGVSGKRAYVGTETRIAVEQVAYAHQHGDSAELIAETFNLTLAQVYAALSYYYDHQEALDAAQREAEALARQLASNEGS